jgi:ribosomal-protein-alanine N-acetyltransferase
MNPQSKPALPPVDPEVKRRREAAAVRAAGAVPAPEGWTVSPLKMADLPAVMRADAAGFAQAWPAHSFLLTTRRGEAYVARGADGRAGASLTLHTAGDVLVVERIAVLPELRRIGLGRLLMAWAAAYAAELGMRALSLHVRDGNDAARGLYLAQGYRVTERREGYYHDGGNSAALTMELALAGPTGGVL